MQQVLRNYTADPWMNYMLNGEFEEAWKISDAILKRKPTKLSSHLPRHQQAIWDGSLLENKKVLIRCYHGLGDTVQFIRYASLLKTIAKEVIVWAQESLIPILQTVEGIDEILPLHDGSPAMEYDVDVEIMELPHIFRTTVATIPNKIPYLHVEPDTTLVAAGKPLIGLVWKAGDWDHRRNVPFDYLEPFHVYDNILIMQENAKAAGWNGQYGTYCGDVSLYEYAKRIKGLDLLITIDSMLAHLAGALGVQVWTLLHADADWRWMRNRNDCPWYPTMRLFRQKVQDDWGSVIKEVIDELRVRYKTIDRDIFT